MEVFRENMTLQQGKDNRVLSSRWKPSTGIHLFALRKPHYNGSKGIQNETKMTFQFLDDKKQTEMSTQEMRPKKVQSRRCTGGSHRRDGNQHSWKNSGGFCASEFLDLSTTDI